MQVLEQQSGHEHQLRLVVCDQNEAPSIEELMKLLKGACKLQQEPLYKSDCIFVVSNQACLIHWQLVAHCYWNSGEKVQQFQPLTHHIRCPVLKMGHSEPIHCLCTAILSTFQNPLASPCPNSIVGSA